MHLKIMGRNDSIPVQTLKAERGSGVIFPLILNLRAGWICVMKSSPVALPLERTPVPTEE